MNFEGHRLDLRTRQLFRGSIEVHLSPKAFDLLRILVENPTRALSKTELQTQLWPETFVTEANLPTLVAELRRALGDSARSSRIVRTVHRFGYAFAGKIAGDAGGAAARPSCWIIWRDREIPMHDGENIIGREPSAALCLDLPSVSRRHARVTVAADGVTVEDLGSKNGTMVREERISGPTRVADLDELQIGSVRLVIRVLHSAAPTQTV